MSVVVGTLTIDLKANTASFAQSMDKMSQLSARTANDIKRSLEKIAAVGLAMGAAIAGGTAEMIKKSVETADAMGKLAQKTGTTAETLSVLSYAAKLADLDTETLGKGLEKLSQAMFKAQNGNVQMQRIFDRLGVSTKNANGHLKDSGIVMEDLAVKFSKMADGSGKTALAMAIFGKGGAAMIPMLNELGEKQAEINEEAHRFGLVLSTSTTQVAAEANDKLKKLGSMFTGLGYSLMSATLPALNELTDKLMDIARSSDLQGLARAFGGEVVKAVHLLGDTLDFAVKHAHALKLALEAIAAVKIASIAIPIVADLAGGGLLNVGKGIDKATLGMLGFERAAKVLPKIGEGISGVASGFYGAAKGASLAEIASVGLETGFGRVGKALTSLSFASVFTSMTSGIGKALTAMKALSAASVFAGLTSALRAIPALFGAIATGALNASKALMLAALSNPWTAAALAITALVALLYKFRNATFSVGGSTYELRDTWNAAWIIMKNTVGVVVDWFKKKMDDIKDAWSGVVTWIKNNPIANALDDSLGIGTDWGARFSKWVGSKLGVPDFAKKALDEAKRQRLAAAAASGTTSSEKTETTPKPLPNTTGLGKPQKDPYGEEINKLNLAIAAQRSYLSVLDGTPDAIQAVTIAEKANSIALEVNKKLLEEFGHKMTAKQEAELKNAVATEESLKSLVNYGKELVSQQHSAELHIQQTRAMAAANLEGDAATRQAAIDNAILALRYEKTTEELKKLTEMEPQLRAMFAAQADADLLAGANHEIFTLRQEAGAQDILRGAILGTIEAQRRAEIQARTYALSQQIDATSAGEARLALIEERSAIEDNMRAQQQAADLAEARRTLGGPLDEYTRDKEHLQDLVVALQDAQDGSLTYEQQLSAASAEQDIFDKAIDRTVQEMLRFGDARDGVDAFFLDMQKEAQSTASIIYEALHSAFDKISDNLAELVTGGKTSFAKMFQDIGKQIVQSEIKQQLQEGLGKLAGKFGITIPGLAAKLDGSSESRALWVRTAGADGFAQPRTTNELTDLIGPNPQESGDQTTRSIGSILSSWFGHKQKSPFGESLGMPEGNELTDLFSSSDDGQSGFGGFGGDESAMDLPTDEGIGDGEGGVLSAITSVIGGLKSGMQSQQGTPKGTASSPFYVKTVGGSGGSPLGGMGGLGSLLGGGGGGGFGGDESIMDQPTDEGIGGGGGFFSGLLSKLTGLLGGGSSGESGGLSSIFSMFGGLLIPHAAGGPVSPSSAYLVGEQGPEILTGVSGSIMSNTNSMRALSGSGGSSVSYSIDARGTDPAQTEQRVQRAIRAAHNSAINTAVQASAERLKRVPHRY